MLLGYVVLGNYIHFIASAENLAKEVGDFKSYISITTQCGEAT